uniref:Uncharacterized protein n=1 Tax=Anguilla anguilla TaxID=7936 RepID=A0A0E9S6G9_ANGAN
MFNLNENTRLSVMTFWFIDVWFPCVFKYTSTDYW